MFYKKRIEELKKRLEREIGYLRNRIVDLEHSIHRIDEQEYIVVQPKEYRLGSINYTSCPVSYSNTNIIIEEKKISIKEVLEMLLKQLGYKINHEYQSESYTLKKKKTKK